MFDFIRSSKKNHVLNIQSSFCEEKINTEYNDYYYSNVVSRASKTMSECRSLRNQIKKTGTEG